MAPINDDNLESDEPIDTSADTSTDTTADTGKSSSPTTEKAAPATGDRAAADASKPEGFGDDWKDRLLTGMPETQRERAQGYLSKRSSPYDVLNAALSADQKISELMRDRVKIPTGKNDDPKEVERFRKAAGIPDKPDGYKVDIPREYGELSELDEELVGEFQQEMHAAGANQKQVDVASKMYFAIQQRVNAAKAAEAMAADRKGLEEIKGFHGKAFPQVVELTNRMFAEGLGKYGLEDPKARTDFLSMRLENGQKLGSFPPFVNFMADLAKERADDGAFDVGDGDDGEDINAKIDKIIAMRDTDIKAYQRMQPELEKLIKRQDRMAKRK